ncbi:hypothetical protein Tco_0824227 [Tanacetum coccineum]|uniref:DUF3846 domain-containing protein n=1 Tax=Tanacetum coccineum TaxID=301880 RepID=A0ABQ5AP74_9ASTR
MKSNENRMSKLIVRDLQYIPPEYGKVVEMTLEEKKKFYAMPLDVQLYYRQFDLALGEPQVLNPDDEDCWFSKETCVLVPNDKVRLPRGKYGGYLGAFGPRSGDELTAWNNYLDGLPTETRNYILSIITQGEEGREGVTPAKCMEEESGKKKTTHDQEY